MANTPKLGIPKIEATNSPTINIHVNEIIDYIDSNMVHEARGPLSSRPSPGVPGRYYTTTNEFPNSTYRDNGTRWHPVTQHAPKTVLSQFFADGAITSDKFSSVSSPPSILDAKSFVYPLFSDLVTPHTLWYARNNDGSISFMSSLQAIYSGQVALPMMDIGLIATPLSEYVSNGTLEIKKSPNGKWELFPLQTEISFNTLRFLAAS